MSFYSVSEIAEMINAQAESIAPDLLPNGHRSGNKWMCSGIADTGRSASMYVNLSGGAIGRWRDMGHAAPGEDKGDMLDLLRLRLGLRDAAAAVQEAKARLGLQDEFRPGRPAEISPEERAARADAARERAESRAAADAQERALKARRARALWLAGVPIGGTPAERYLRGRGIRDVGSDGTSSGWPGSLHFHADVWNKDAGCKLPCMVAAIFDAGGQQMGTHRTYLQQRQDGSWTKFSGGEAKKVLGSMWGGFIPIAKGASGKSMRGMPAGEAVYVTEGIEDALVVRMMKPDARVITSISLGNMGAIVLPPAARELVIVADRDTKPDAQEQLERVIAAQQARGLGVRLVMPPAPHKDINDWWQAMAAASQQGAAA